jgi:hypothetical protein
MGHEPQPDDGEGHLHEGDPRKCTGRLLRTPGNRRAQCIQLSFAEQARQETHATQGKPAIDAQAEDIAHDADDDGERCRIPAPDPRRPDCGQNGHDADARKLAADEPADFGFRESELTTDGIDENRFDIE